MLFFFNKNIVVCFLFFVILTELIQNFLSIMVNDNNVKQAWWYPAVNMFVRISGWIIGPIIIALVLGKFLDTFFGTKPWIFVFLTSIAFMFSLFKLINEMSIQIKKIEKDKQEKNNRNHNLKNRK
jgi:F0F1-type ATP synthase assembly protein I